MRQMPAALTALWEAGGPFIGDEGAYNAYVTVEPAWWLTEEDTFTVAGGDPLKRPYRWFQRADNSQVEVVVPNIKTIGIDAGGDDAASCTIVMLNQRMDPNLTGQSARLGDPGYYTPRRAHAASTARWGYTANTWQDYLVEGAMLRTYEGYGGRDKTLAQALTDGNVVRTGVWIIDKVSPNPRTGRLTLTCRDPAGALLVDQQLFPPIIPPAYYPTGLRYCRFEYESFTAPAIDEYDFDAPTHIGADGWFKWVTDITFTPKGDGYWIVGTDGGVFAMGRAPFFGSMGSGGLDSPAVGIAPHPDGLGYWMVTETGSVYAFGSSLHHGGSGLIDVVAIRSSASGNGYWITQADGGVFAYGDAPFAGSLPPSPSPIVDMTPTISGNGYWLVNEDGQVYAYGDAVHLGNMTVPAGETAVGLGVHPEETGYWIVTDVGTIESFGASEDQRPNGDFPPYQTPPGVLDDQIMAISPSPSGLGWVLVGGDGGVFSFGDAPFFGSLPDGRTYQTQVDGNYFDFVEIIRDLLLWAGWLLKGSTGVFGNLESTGTYAVACLDPAMFDKRPIMDPITQLKETVGYITYVDGDGGFHFETPNWWAPGNFWEDGTPTEVIFELGDEVNLIDWQPTRELGPMRSELIISSDDPKAGFLTTITTRYVPDDVSMLRGMSRPAMWVNKNFTSEIEQQVMAELIAMHIFFARFKGQATVPGYPGIGINDQVRVYERSTGEAFIHYIRTKSTEGDLDTGVYKMTLGTNRLGTEDNWAVAV